MCQCRLQMHSVSQTLFASIHPLAKRLTLVVMILVIGFSIEHAEDLEDVAVTVISVELVAGPVEAKDQLLYTSRGNWSRTRDAGTPYPSVLSILTSLMLC